MKLAIERNVYSSFPKVEQSLASRRTVPIKQLPAKAQTTTLSYWQKASVAAAFTLAALSAAYLAFSSKSESPTLPIQPITPAQITTHDTHDVVINMSVFTSHVSLNATYNDHSYQRSPLVPLQLFSSLSLENETVENPQVKLEDNSEAPSAQSIKSSTPRGRTPASKYPSSVYVVIGATLALLSAQKVANLCSTKRKEPIPAPIALQSDKEGEVIVGQSDEAKKEAAPHPATAFASNFKATHLKSPDPTTPPPETGRANVETQTSASLASTDSEVSKTFSNKLKPRQLFNTPVDQSVVKTGQQVEDPQEFVSPPRGTPSKNMTPSQRANARKRRKAKEAKTRERPPEVASPENTPSRGNGANNSKEYLAKKSISPSMNRSMGVNQSSLERQLNPQPQALLPIADLSTFVSPPYHVHGAFSLALQEGKTYLQPPPPPPPKDDAEDRIKANRGFFAGSEDESDDENDGSEPCSPGPASSPIKPLNRREGRNVRNKFPPQPPEASSTSAPAQVPRKGPVPLVKLTDEARLYVTPIAKRERQKVSPPSTGGGFTPNTCDRQDTQDA